MSYTLEFQTMNPVISNNISLKYQSFTLSSGRDIGFNKSEFVTKTQLLCLQSKHIKKTK